MACDDVRKFAFQSPKTPRGAVIQLLCTMWVAGLIGALGSDEFVEREKAHETLYAAPQLAAAQLMRAAHTHPDPEVRHRAGRIVMSRRQFITIAPPIPHTTRASSPSRRR